MFKIGKIVDTHSDAFVINYLFKTKYISVYTYKDIYLGYGFISFHNSYHKFNTTVLVLKNFNLSIRVNW